MNEQRGITVVAAIGLVVSVILAILLINNLQKQQKANSQTGPAPDPNSFE
jgi:competence protein ComGC